MIKRAKNGIGAIATHNGTGLGMGLLSWPWYEAEGSDKSWPFLRTLCSVSKTPSMRAWTVQVRFMAACVVLKLSTRLIWR